MRSGKTSRKPQEKKSDEICVSKKKKKTTRQLKEVNWLGSLIYNEI
jgi:hypothetical protein